MSTDGEPDRRTRAHLICGFAPLLFFVAILIQDALRTGYDPINHSGSELSNGDWGWVQITNFVVTGLLTMAFAVGVRRVLDKGRGLRAIPIVTGILGFCLIIAGVFVTDPDAGFPPGVQPPAAPTVHGWIHNLNLFPAWAALTAAILMTAYRSLVRREKLAWILFNAVAGILTPVTMYIAARHFNMATLTGSGHGLWQRISQAIGFGWYALFAVRLLRSTSRETPQMAAVSLSSTRS
jgi:hypothetical protein